MSAELRELSAEECRLLIQDGGVGRVAFRSSKGLEIVPVNFQLYGDSIVFRTTLYTELGLHGPGANAVFEVDDLDAEQQVGWSVVARGQLHVVADPAENSAIRLGSDPQPWAGGVRRLYLQLPWRELTGRRLEPL
jgi:nitroimidazol reductase NimA-like FMN-containing flavoprotein (pyridoxamine 5'-phosphate oxidase superfamily)